jgi:hypothetical protein
MTLRVSASWTFDIGLEPITYGVDGDLCLFPHTLLTAWPLACEPKTDY